MRTIVNWCLDRRSIIILATILVFVGGIVGSTKLRQQLFPDFDLPFAIITMEAPNLDANSIDSQVSLPLDRALSTIDGVKGVTTMASDGRIRVYAQLDYGVDTSDKQRDISDVISRLDLPSELSAPQFAGGFNEQAVVVAAVRADNNDLSNASTVAKKLRSELEQVDGVGRVDMGGGSDLKTLVTIPKRALSMGVTTQNIATAINDSSARSNIGVITGKQGPQSVVIQGSNASNNLNTLKKLYIAKANAPLGSFASIKSIDAADNAFALVNGKPALTLSIYRKTGSDEVSTVDKAMEVIDEAKIDSNNTTIDVLYDTAKDVRASIKGLIVEGLLGALFAVIVIFLFLRNLASTLVAAVSIPTSIVFGLLAAWALGLTLNLITLAGLTIAIGRVIDDGIVVLENIHKHLERGENKRAAMINGTGEVAVAIASSTIATVAVFLPIGLIGGLISEIFLSFSIIVTVALLASLLVAVTVIPVIGSFVLKPSKKTLAVEEDVFSRLVTPATTFGIRWRWPVLITAIISVVAVFTAVGMGAIPTQFLPSEGANLVAGTVELPPGTKASEAKKILQPLNKHLASLKSVNDIQIKYGITSSESAYDPSVGINTAEFIVTLKDEVKGEDVEHALRSFGNKQYPNAFTVHVLSEGPPAGTFQLNVNGKDSATIAKAATMIDKLLHKNAKKWELVEISSQAATTMPQLVAKVRANAPASTTTIQQSLQGVTRPITVDAIPGSIPVSIMVDPRETATSQQLQTIPVPLISGALAPLNSVADISTVDEPIYLNRVNGTLSGRVRARMLGDDTAGVTRKIHKEVEALDLPSGVTLDWDQGDAQFVQEMFTDMGAAMLIAVLLVFFVLIIFFGSLTYPFVILAPVLFSFIGSFGALILTHRALGLPAMIGQLLLIGIIVSNSILLVDATLRLRKQGVARDEALLKAAQLRVRPVLMTATATIAALIPLSLGVSGEGGLISSTLGTVVIGGLLIATLLTLVIVPSVYRMFDRDKDMRVKEK